MARLPGGCAGPSDAYADAHPVGAPCIVAKDAPFIYRFLQRVIWIVVRGIVRPDVTGVEHVPRPVPWSWRATISTPWISLPSASPSRAAGRVRRRQVAERARRLDPGARDTRHPRGALGEAEREAMNQALEVLRAGGTLAVAPEGTWSRTRGLQDGRDGAVYLASRTGATIIPVAAGVRSGHLTRGDICAGPKSTSASARRSTCSPARSAPVPPSCTATPTLSC